MLKHYKIFGSRTQSKLPIGEFAISAAQGLANNRSGLPAIHLKTDSSHTFATFFDEFATTGTLLKGVVKVITLKF